MQDIGHVAVGGLADLGKASLPQQFQPKDPKTVNPSAPPVGFLILAGPFNSKDPLQVAQASAYFATYITWKLAGFNPQLVPGTDGNLYWVDTNSPVK